MSHSLCGRRVGSQVTSHSAYAPPRGSLSRLLQQAFSCQRIATSSSDESRGECARPQLVLPGVRTVQQLPPRLAQPRAGGVPAGGLAQQERKGGVFDNPIKGVPPHDMRHFMAEHEGDLVPCLRTWTSALLNHGGDRGDRVPLQPIVDEQDQESILSCKP